MVWCQTLASAMAAARMAERESTHQQPAYWVEACDEQGNILSSTIVSGLPEIDEQCKRIHLQWRINEVVPSPAKPNIWELAACDLKGLRSLSLGQMTTSATGAKLQMVLQTSEQLKR